MKEVPSPLPGFRWHTSLQVIMTLFIGGAGSLAAMAIALGYDTAFVATHHLFRIIVLLLLLPVLLRIFGQTQANASANGGGPMHGP